MLSIHKPLFVSISLASLMVSPCWSADMGEEPIELSGVRGGLVVVLNDEQLTSEIRINDGYLVQGLFQDEKGKTSAREEIQSKGTYGHVTVRSWNGDALPYLDNMVNLVVADDQSSVSLDEIFRVLPDQIWRHGCRSEAREGRDQRDLLLTP